MDVINSAAIIVQHTATPHVKEPATLVVLEHVMGHVKQHQHHQHVRAIVAKLIVL